VKSFNFLKASLKPEICEIFRALKTNMIFISKVETPTIQRYQIYIEGCQIERLGKARRSPLC
jgi:hypothetical protein